MLLLLLLITKAHCSPNDVKYCRDEEFIINGDGQVARLVESRGNGPHGQAQIDTPQQEQELRWNRNTRRQNSAVTNYLVCQVWECQLKRCDLTRPERLFLLPLSFAASLKVTPSRRCMNFLKATLETTLHI